MTGKNTKPHSQRKNGRKAREKLQRKVEAEARQAEYDKLSPEEKKTHNPNK